MTSEYLEEITTREKLIKDLEKIDNDLADRLTKLTLRSHHNRIGYSSQCKTCNSPYVDQIEELYEAGHSYQYIIDTLDLDLSVMSLSRHFKKHYPKRTRYKLEKKKEMLETVIDTINKHPYLDTVFNTFDYEELTDFTRYNGYCIDCNMLCHKIPAKQVSSFLEVQEEYDKELRDIKYENNLYYVSSYDTPTYETIEILEKKLECFTCKNLNYNVYLHTLEVLVFRLLGASINFREPMLLNLLEFKYDDDLEDLVNDLLPVAESK